MMATRAPAGSRYLWLWFVLAFAIMSWGFGPNLWQANGPIDLKRYIHGGFAVGWMGLLIAQSWLIGTGRWAWHGRIGRFSRYVTPLLVASALWVVTDMLGPHSHFDRDLRLQLAWGDLWSLAMFSALYVAAIVNRRRFPIHARAMASTVFVVLPPALGRVYGPFLGGLEPALAPSYWTVEAALAALTLYDAARRRFYWPFPSTLAATVAMQATMAASTHWAPFIVIATLLGLPPA